MPPFNVLLRRFKDSFIIVTLETPGVSQCMQENVINLLRILPRFPQRETEENSARIDRAASYALTSFK